MTDVRALICIKILLTDNLPVLVLLHDPGGESVEVEVGLRLAHNELEDHSYVTSKKNAHNPFST